MITKIKSIKNLAVFQNFIWDTDLRDDGNNIILFKPINIFYGRNYSGKTTLSRIIRALEKGRLSDKYELPEFEVSFNGSPDATIESLTRHGKKIRVFNEDFVIENLRFISNPEESITPFAILGGNTTIELEIQALKNELGNNEKDNESGFYLELKNVNTTSKTALDTYKTALNNLNIQLSNKATNNPNGIKYKSDKFGDQNYNKPKLENDISLVLKASYVPLTDEEVTLKLNTLKEILNQDILVNSRPSIDLKTLNEKVKDLVTRPISNSDKIEQLVKDSILNRWVKEGRVLHKEKLKNCSFCGSEIAETRWQELDSHFDEESEKLEKEIDSLLQFIDSTINSINQQVPINKNAFYSKFHSNLDRLISFRESVIEKVSTELNNLKYSLNNRRNDLLNQKLHLDVKDNTKRLEWCWSIYENYRIAANLYGNSLENEQIEAKRLLRLREVSDFIGDIQYKNEISKIKKLEVASEAETQKKNGINNKISDQIRSIREKERLMNDEEKGAVKVNEYLNNYFGHDFLTLQALEEENQIDGKKIRFEIIRNGKKAHHLSEGECSLIAFCYFMAKLEDIETKGSKPIIWIDDPISSLDNNHIFFIYSLINSEIVQAQEFEQLFISTHNLDFLKYLKRLPGALNKNQCHYFLLSREIDNSKIKLMPRYLKDYVTEFNYLFHQIYMCSIIEDNDENQHNLFYNFANNTRKFLEAFLYYKYPNALDDKDKLTRFFGNNRQASVMTDRINNEFSHLEGLFERSMLPIDVPEMKKTAKFILNKIQEKDIEQYEALLLSIGIQPTTETE